MSEWQTVAIGEICDLVTSGGTPLTSQKEYYHNGSIPWVKTKEVNQCRLYGTENHITQLGLDNSSAKLIPENSIIIAMYGDGKTAGRVALNKVPVTTNQACCNLILNKQKANYDFVFYNLMGRYDELVSKKTGSGQQNLNGKIIKEIEIDLPSLPEQKAIASVLSSLDDKIDLLHRQNKTLEAMAETLFRQWFIEEAKEDWEDAVLGDIATNVRVNATTESIESDEIYIGLEHIERRHIALSQHGIGSDVASNKSRFKKHDILFGKLRPYFHKVCIAPFDGICSTDILVLRAKKEVLITFTLFAFFQDSVVEYANLASGGTRMPRADWGSLSQYPIAIPPVDLLHQFNDLVLPSIEKIHTNLVQIQTLENLRDTLLPKLMSGEVRIQYQTEEVA